MKTFPHLSDEQLADEIVTWAGRLAAGEAEQSALLADFDRREAWAGPGLLSCAHWLAWRTGLSPGAARERVRVARALGDLPHVEQAYSAGRLSFSQVRAVTRVASSADEHTWVDVARHATGGQLERLVRGCAARDGTSRTRRIRKRRRTGCARPRRMPKMAASS